MRNVLKYLAAGMAALGGAFTSPGTIVPPEPFSTRTRRVTASERQSDADAIRSDWEAVGRDLRWAMDKFEAEQASGDGAPHSAARR